MADDAQKKPPTKTEILTKLADMTGISKKEVAAVLEALESEIRRNLSNEGPGVFAIPGLLKIEKKEVPARVAETKPNPFRKGEMMDVAARPASCKIKLRALKNLKDMV